MSELSYLEKLLDGVEVEWKTLGSIAELKRGTSITKKDVIDGTIPVVAGGRTPAYYHNTSNRDGQTIVIAGSGAYAGFVSWWEEPIFVSDAFTVKPHNILLPRYCYHFLMNMQQQLHEFKSGGGVPHVYPRDVSPILIPIPCPDTPEKSLAIQSEIVRILDKFTALTAELTAELNMRKKQYNYYRDQLLSFKEGEVKWKTLGEITEINTGQKPSEILDKAATFDYINAGTSRSGYTTMSNCDGDTVTTPSRGQGGIGFVGYQKTPFWLGPLCYKIKSLNNEILINKFLFYTLQSRNRILLSLKKEGGVPAVNKIDLAKLIIPLPSLDEQKRIVSLLDKFDTLTNSITEGLPREIELRQKQYEYYRDLLFSFPKPETVSN
ncbi:restriction endonuclease subunit S [Escherichia coli]|uniref:restriction endonuclease subunit S n=1 Tax=Escherichia coli TaxID=562 RepID=UPI001795BB72|nr:restriction endonuclease subunit S [Escherichia coli]EFH1049273.1 restriction endonuclease subunit S [Escherichia coli]EIS3583183.1 restriction endonuclease subunit S [Escherichia coli]MED8094333.1 restriction endonuclease subunit S [Escherichia coli]HCN6339999.1 restriction endonuclease subunit S [Escherichia coli]